MEVSKMDEITLKDKTAKLFDDLEGMLSRLLSVSGLNLSDLGDVDDAIALLIRDYCRLMSSCKELAVEQAGKLDELDKLDTILLKVEAIERMCKNGK